MVDRLKIDPEVVPELVRESERGFAFLRIQFLAAAVEEKFSVFHLFVFHPHLVSFSSSSSSLPKSPQCQHCYVNYGTTLAGLVLTPHAPHHDKHNPPRKQQRENGSSSAAASNGKNDPDPVVAAAAAELAASLAEDARVEREMHQFYDEWHERVHASLPYEQLFPPRAHPHNLALKALLRSLPENVARLVFTNADDAHAAKCLNMMGLDVETDFDDIITFESVMRDAAALGLVRRGRPVVCKPADVAFRLALRAASRAVARKKKGKEEGASDSHPPLLDPGEFLSRGLFPFERSGSGAKNLFYCFSLEVA